MFPAVLGTDCGWNGRVNLFLVLRMPLLAAIKVVCQRSKTKGQTLA
jgi:hypothetical protein